MRYDDELGALRRDLDDLLNRAATLKDRISSFERKIKPESSGPIAEPPPLPPVRAIPVFSADHGAKPKVQSPADEIVPTPAPARLPEFTEKPRKSEVPGAAELAMPRASVEERIWKYWMPRVSGVLLAIGVAWALYYVGPHTPAWVRIAFGYCCSAALLAAGWKFEKPYLQYARVLYGTSIGVSYFVSFAAHYIAASRIIESETAGIGLLVAVVLVWGFVAQIRRSRIVATLVTMLGHLTMGLAFFTTGELARYSIAGVAILGLGSAFFLLYNRWYFVAMVGLAGCYVNHTLWTIHFSGTMPIPAFRVAFGFLWVYMLTFALAELFCAEDVRRTKIPTRFRTMFVTANTVLFCTIATLTLLRYENMWAYRDRFLLAYSCVAALIGLGYLRLRNGDPLYNVYLTKAVSAFTLFLAVRYGQGTLTASLAVESVVLLYSSRRSGLVVTRLLAFGAATLCVAQGLYTVASVGHVAYSDPVYLRRVVESGFAVAGLFTASQLYQRTDWSTRTAHALPFGRDTLDMLWDLDIVAQPASMNRRKPFGGLQFPYIYALGGGMLFVAFTLMLNSQERATAFSAYFVLAMTLIALALGSRPFGLVAMLALVPAAGATLIGIAISASPSIGLIGLTFGTVMAAGVAADRRVAGRHEGLAFHQMAASPYLLYCAAALIFSAHLIYRSETGVRAAMYFAVAAAIAGGLIAVLHRRALATAAVMLLALGVVVWIVPSNPGGTGEWHAAAVATIATSIFIDRYLSRRREEDALRPWASAALCLSWPLLFHYVGTLGRVPSQFYHVEIGDFAVPRFGYFDSDWVPFALAIVSFAYTVYAAFVRTRVAIVLAVVNAILASMYIVNTAYRPWKSMATLPLMGGFLALALFWVLCERFAARTKTPKLAPLIDPSCGVSIGVATLLLVLMVERLPSVSNYFLAIGWGMLAMVLFGVSLLTQQRFYRFAGLGVFLLAIMRLFYDARNLEGIYRPLAFIGLAVLLLIVSFGYYRAFRDVDARRLNEKTKMNEQHPGVPPPGPPPIS